MEGDDIVWERNEVSSPCKKICVLDKVSGYCIGCFRTRDEIVKWSSMPNEARLSIVSKADEREKEMYGKGSRRRKSFPTKKEENHDDT